MTVLFGADGVGKTTVLGAIATTRPGHALPIIPRRTRVDDAAPREVPFALADWILGDDDPERPHPLRVMSPNAQIQDDENALRRREQALFDKRAQERGGYAFAAFSGARWFSRTPVMLTTPERSVVRYDVRTSASFDDASRADLTRETKQVLSYAGIAKALEPAASDLGALDAALRDVSQIALAPFNAQYEGVHAKTLEPIFSHEGRDAIFEELPRGARHLVAIVTGALRVLHGAYASQESCKPLREREGVIVVDDLETQQDAALLKHVPALLKASLPRVQWILATSATPVTLGCERDEVLALRREPDESRVIVHEGAFAVLH
ncbi:MAG TPA: hypothetical protein VH054_13645 [Polyangiaceae bacterium]|nr:hypothetical protein [Polyangiaceae bacterium]